MSLTKLETSIQAPVEWLVRALVELAKRELAKANQTCGDCWPAGQEWNELGPSSQHAFMHRAREAAGIPHEQYRDLIAIATMGPDADSLDALWTELDKPLAAPNPVLSQDTP